MPTLRLDGKAPYTPANARAQAAAAKLDANNDGELTLDEVKQASPEAQHELFNAMAFDEFLGKVNRWHAQPLWRAIGGWITGDRDRKDFMRAAEVTNIVGKLPTVNQIVTTGNSITIRSRYDDEK
jgi:hypothetical protein